MAILKKGRSANALSLLADEKDETPGLLSATGDRVEILVLANTFGELSQGGWVENRRCADIRIC